MEDQIKIDIVEFTSEQLSGWEEYRQALYIQKAKSDDLFEKAITFISSGALALTLTFHDKIVPVENSTFVIIIAIGWGLLVATLFVNLISHYQSSKSTDACIDEVDKIIDYKINYSTFHKNLNNRNNRIDNLNRISIYLLGAGLFLIIIYVSINIYHDKTTKTETIIKNTGSTKTQNEHSRTEGAYNTSTFSTIK